MNHDIFIDATFPITPAPFYQFLPPWGMILLQIYMFQQLRYTDDLADRSIQTYTPFLWCNSRANSEGILVQTNNCIEIYNRRIEENFQNADSNIYAFITVIIHEEHYITELINGILKGKILLQMEKITSE
ncbi:hypothetical protein MXB_3446 [Myxobolus squamalis]|nr:hypothetical protein MXB_3446 [Myxobolus squamalis]